MKHPIPVQRAMIVACILIVIATPTLSEATEKPPTPPIVEVLQQEAAKLRAFVDSNLATEFLAATAQLPEAPERVVLRDPANRRQLSLFGHYTILRKPHRR